MGRADLQPELCLPARSADEILRESLARAKARLAAATTPGERADLHDDVRRLRLLLGTPDREAGNG